MDNENDGSEEVEISEEQEVEPGPNEISPSGAAVKELVTLLLQRVASRGRKEFTRAAEQGRVQLDLRQLKRDRNTMYEKLGREARALVEGGEVNHPGLLRGVSRIRTLDEQIESTTEQRAVSSETIEEA